MGIIQNALNQAIGTAGIAARLSPDYETKQELHKLGKQEKALSLQQESLPTIDPAEFEKGETVLAKQHKEILEKQAENAQKQFELNPTKEAMKKATLARSGAGQGPLWVTPADHDEILQEQVMSELTKKQASKQAQKRKFKDYLGKLETSLGGKVGDLPKDLQALIAKQYSSTERKSLMNKIDKERNK